MRTRAVFVFLAALLSLGASGMRSLNEEGNRRYREGRFEDALEAYTAAQAEAPESPAIRYNMGNALYRLESFPEALREYDSVSGAEGALGLDSAFNAGNAAYRQGEYEEALRRYAEVLLADPADGDARRNLELTLRRLEEQEQQQQEPCDQKEEGGEQEEQEPQPQDDQEEGPQEETPEEGGEQEQTQDSGQPPEERPPTQEELTRQQAMRILDSLEEQEIEALRQAQKEEAKRRGAGSRYGDW
jgi:tetratricopeptide (TPR) repeat protein